MHQGDFNSSTFYPPPPPPPQQQFPNPNPNPPPSYQQPDPSSYASAPPFSPSDYHQQQPFSLVHQPYHPDPPLPIAPAQRTASFPSFESHHRPPFPQNQQQPQQFYPPPFDRNQNQGGVNYAPAPAPAPAPAAPAQQYPASYNLTAYDSLCEPASHVKFDHSTSGGAVNGSGGGGGAAYYDDALSRYGGGGGSGGGYARSHSHVGTDYFAKRPEANAYSGQSEDLYGEGVYPYQAKSKVEPYGARGTGAKSSTWTGAFDDYGRAISIPELGEKKAGGSGASKIVKSVPKVETQQDVQSGVQKFRVKLLAESGGQSTMDVLCQVGERVCYGVAAYFDS